MLRPTLLQILLPSLLAGCAGFDPTGVWLFTIAETAATGDECDESVFHNFAEAELPEESEEESDWTEQESADQSERVTFGHIAASGDSYLLIIDGWVLPQAEGGSELQHTFQWEQSELRDSSASHAAGYLFIDETEQTETTRLVLTFPETAPKEGAAVITGTWESESTSLQSWEEADTWPDDEGFEIGETGQIPAGSWLVVEETDTESGELVQSAAVNTRDASECSETPCVLTVNSACLYSYSLSAEHSDIDPSDIDWEDAGWSAGL